MEPDGANVSEVESKIKAGNKTSFQSEGYAQGGGMALNYFRGKAPYPHCFGQAASFGAGLGCPDIPAAAGQSGQTLLDELRGNKFCRMTNIGTGFGSRN